jgi:hypothetical protein
MWLPLAPGIDQAPLTLDAIAHDHNFAFMTGGYFGSGYATVLYEYDARALAGVPGERVDLRLVKRTTLPQGKVMFYRATEDVHRQERPEEFSISINLVVPTLSLTRAQRFFDVSTGRVSATSHLAQGRPLALCELASHVGGETTAQLLADVAQRNPIPHLRAAAFESLSSLDSQAGAEIGHTMLSDPDGYVRSAVEAALGKQR